MINKQLLDPESIVIVGGSNDVSKPGGKVLKNLLSGSYAGRVYVLNPQEKEVQGVQSFPGPDSLPNVDLAILAIAARHCPQSVEFLARKKNTRAFIILSAGFSEESEEGAQWEKKIADTIHNTGGCLIGPNCIGFLNHNYYGIFTTPLPETNPAGVDFISGSGATAVFIMESGIPKGLTFSSVYSVGNSAQTGVEDVLKYLDESFDPETSSRIKLLYFESVNKPELLLKHGRSLMQKGCRIAAIKAGRSEAGSRAASSHTGALASPDIAVDALFKKAGILRCYSREELSTVAAIYNHPLPEGKNMAIVTHAGGPAVMLTDVFSEAGLQVPEIKGPAADALLEKLHPGSSVANPIDFLATGTAEQLGVIIDACEKHFENIDAIIVIFGSPGLFPVNPVYDVLDQKMKSCRKPIYPVLPSVINAGDAIEEFISGDRVFFPDEVVFGRALSRVLKSMEAPAAASKTPKVDKRMIRPVIESAGAGYLDSGVVTALLDASDIRRVAELVATTAKEAVKVAKETGFPLVMKCVGPVHKSDVDGVALNISNVEEAIAEYNRMKKIPGMKTILIQPMISGLELFAGVKKEGAFGHLLMCGLGGIFVEVLKDVSVAMLPLDPGEANRMIRSLKGYEIIKGVRNQEGVDENLFAEVLERLSGLIAVAPEIVEMDLNPLIGRGDQMHCVDARIRIE